MKKGWGRNRGCCKKRQGGSDLLVGRGQPKFVTGSVGRVLVSRLRSFSFQIEIEAFGKSGMTEFPSGSRPAFLPQNLLETARPTLRRRVSKRDSSPHSLHHGHSGSS